MILDRALFLIELVTGFLMWIFESPAEHLRRLRYLITALSRFLRKSNRTKHVPCGIIFSTEILSK